MMDKHFPQDEMLKTAKSFEAGAGSDRPIRFDQSWDTCGLEEKIERLRRVLMDYRWSHADLQRRTRYFEDHQHDASGDIMIPIQTLTRNEGQASSYDFLK